MWIVSFFSEDGSPSLGLNPVVNIRDVSDGSLVVSEGLMLEKGDGFYSYDFVGYDSAKDYAILCDSIVLSGTNERYAYASSGEYNTSLNAIQSTVDNVDVRTLLIRKIQTNKLELMDGSVSNWVLYDDPPNEDVPLLTFNVTDKDDNLIVQQTHIPSKRSKGY